jgi:hypothetical protein
MAILAWSRQALLRAVLAFVTSGALGACDRPDGPPPAPSSTSAGAGTAAAVTRAVIRMDAAHDAMTVKDAAPYAIAPSARLEIEIGDYRFARRDAGRRRPTRFTSSTDRPAITGRASRAGGSCSTPPRSTR